MEYQRFIPKIKKDKEYLFLDLAVPRDIDEKLAELENINIYNLDDIWAVYNKNSNHRENLLNEYSYLIEEQINKLQEKIEDSLKYCKEN